MIALGHLKLLLFVSCVLAASSELDALTTTSSHDLPRNRSTSFITYSVRSTRYVPFPRPTAIPTQDPMYTRTIYLSYPYSMPTTTKWSFTTESPVFTICPLPLTSPGSAPWRRQIPDLSSTPRAPFLNQTSSVEVVTTCSTAFVTRVTTACKTTLTPLGGLLIHITDCSQRITFSTDHGFVVESRKKPELLTTNYIAPWANVISGVPTGTVEALVCPRDGLCTTYLEYWGTRALLAVSTSTSTIRFATILEGPSVVIVNDIQTITISDTTRQSLSVSTTIEVVRTSQSYLIVPFTLSTILPSPSSVPDAPFPLTTTAISTLSTTITLTTTRYVTIPVGDDGDDDDEDWWKDS